MNEKFIRLQSWRTTGLAAFLFGFICWGAGLDFWNAALGSTLAAGIVGYGTAIGLAWYAVRADHPLTIATVDEPRPSVALPTATPIRAARADAPVVNEANAGQYTVFARPTMSSELLRKFTAAIDSGAIEPDKISGRALGRAFGIDKNNAEVVRFLDQLIEMGWVKENGLRWELVNSKLPHSQHTARG